MLKTNESAENYLETILVLSQKKPVVRGVDIAEELGFKKSSVSVAMKNLREKDRRCRRRTFRPLFCLLSAVNGPSGHCL